MEGLNNINGTQGVTPPMNQQTRPNQPPQGGQAPPPPFSTEISQMGQLFSAVEETGETANSELKLFVASLFEALHSGTFDTETLTENASDTIKEIAEEAGVDLAAVLSEFQENAPQMNGTPPPGPSPNGKGHHGPPPPPPESESSTIFSDEDSSYMEDILTDDATS
jgi:hypothetical protein